MRHLTRMTLPTNSTLRHSRTRFCWRLIAVLWLGISLTSCVRDLPLNVQVIDDKVAFSTTWRGNLCRLSIVVYDDQGATAWQFYTDPNPLSTTCSDMFPIRYGVLPKGAIVQSAADPLQPGRLYLVSASVGGANGEAAFALYRGGDRIGVHQVPKDLQIVDAVRRKTGQYVFATGD